MSSMELWIWDVTHGSAAYLRSPTNRHFVFDLGVGDRSLGDKTFSPLKLLARNGVSQLDSVIITHPHRDHLDDIFNFDLLTPRTLVRPKHLTEAEIRAGNKPGDAPVVNKFLEVHNRYNAPVAAGTDPFDPAMSGMEILRFQPTSADRSNLNNHSIVSFLSFAGVTICLPGDNEAPSWKELLLKDDFTTALRRTHILVAPHHGRVAGYCDDLFRDWQPHLVIVSDGPEGTTSAVNEYHRQAKGWTVTSRSMSGAEKRYVLTTRADGSIRIEVSRGASGATLGVSKE